MSSVLGENVKISIFGQSHSDAIGVVIDGLPAGEAVDLEALQGFMKRRAPGQNAMSTPRKEADAPKILAGLTPDGRTCGTPLCAVIENTNTRSKDYDKLRTLPRPGHSDYTAFIKYGDAHDIRGGGHFSGRLTAPLCIAGGIAKQILARKGIFVCAKVDRIAGIDDQKTDYLTTSPAQLEQLTKKDLTVADDAAGEKMRAAIEQARQNNDSCGGVIACAVYGLPAGLGGPLFGGLEGKLSTALFGIPAVKGVEFGDGFGAADALGSENNDAFTVKDGKIVTKTNHSGGILGGISNGMPLVMRAAFKPTPSISTPQTTVNLDTMEEETLVVGGRHDPCIVPRAVPVVEAAVACVILDLLEA